MAEATGGTVFVVMATEWENAFPVAVFTHRSAADAARQMLEGPDADPRARYSFSVDEVPLNPAHVEQPGS